MDGIGILLVCVAGYVAVRVLVRMMLARRNRLWAELEAQAAAARRRDRQRAAEEAESSRARSA